MADRCSPVSTTPRKRAPDWHSPERIIDLALWIVPILFALEFYKEGLRTELQQDDFAWLGLRLEIHTAWDFLRVLFEPRAQGTVRPLSERLFFIVYSIIFGTWAPAYRATAFFFQACNLLLLNAIGRRLTGSALVGFGAAMIWTCNPSMAVPLSWTSAFNQIMSAFFILGAFFFLIRFVHDENSSDWRRQWLFYLLGFGALELNVVYPVLASSYSAFCAPKIMRKTLLLWIPAVVYIVVHRTYASSNMTGEYAMDLGWSMLAVFVDLWGRTLGPSQLSILYPVSPWFGTIGTVVLTTALVWFAVTRGRADRRLGAFLLLWFVIGIGPYLPLAHHRMNYYPFLASAGLALLAAWGLRVAWLRSAATGGLAAGLLLLHMGSAAPIARAQMFYYYVHGERVRALIDGVVDLKREHPTRTILIADVDEPLFWGAIYDNPFRLWGIEKIYLLPDNDIGGSDRYLASREQFELEPENSIEPLVVKLIDGSLQTIQMADASP